MFLFLRVAERGAWNRTVRRATVFRQRCAGFVAGLHRHALPISYTSTLGKQNQTQFNLLESGTVKGPRCLDNDESLRHHSWLDAMGTARTLPETEKLVRFSLDGHYLLLRGLLYQFLAGTHYS